MAYDALTLTVLAEELRSTLIGGKITKIYQPERDEIILFVFNKQTYKLLISANAGVNRIHLTEMPTDNPKTAPSFCMLLRKHLTNATIAGITQMPYERVLEFDLQVNDELGYRKNMKLIFELTGKTSNVILTDEGYTILDSIKHLPQDIDSKRIIISGAKYAFFPPQVKIFPFDLPRVREFLSTCNTPLRKTLPEVLLGVSVSTVNEILYKIDENDHTIVNHSLVVERLAQYQANLKRKRPNVVLRDGNPIDVNPFDYQSVTGEKIYFDTLNRAHDYYFYLLDKTQRALSKAKSISTIVKNAVSRTEKKLAIQRQSVLEAESREQFKHCGDLVLSNVWQIKQGASELTCYDYEIEQNVTIPLDKQLTPQQNAQNYYKKYRKLKSSAEHNTALIEENIKLLEYLNTIKASLKYCVEADDLQQIRDELIEIGLIREKQPSKKKTDAPLKPLRYEAQGYTIYVGKNNAQNNFVTFKLARPNDVWLHTQKIHSSHVVIVNDKNTAIPDGVIVTAAEICAYFSQASGGSKIAVDYTEKANVKKPNKAPLGFVVYDTYKTLLVNPDRHVTLLKQ